MPTSPDAQARVSMLSLEAYARWASRALNRLSGGGSEMFIRLADNEFYADPDMAVQRAQERIDTIRRLHAATRTPDTQPEGEVERLREALERIGKLAEENTSVSGSRSLQLAMHVIAQAARAAIAAQVTKP